MFSRVLVANRGEIALRVVRALREMGIESVVAYSQADKDTRAVQEADIAVCIGPAPSAKSYLNFAAVIGAFALLLVVGSAFTLLLGPNLQALFDALYN